MSLNIYKITNVGYHVKKVRFKDGTSMRFIKDINGYWAILKD